MTWLYVCATTIGLMLIVPTVLQAIDRREPASQESLAKTPASASARPISPFEFAAFAATTFGVAGLIIAEFEPGPWMTLIAAATLGLAAGAVHPEVLSALARPRRRT